MKFILLFALLLPACTPSQTSLATGDYKSMFSLIEGTGSLSRSPDNTVTFRWVIRQDAFDGISPSENHEGLRKDMLAKWVATQDACDKGYSITKVTNPPDHLIYEGHCV